MALAEKPVVFCALDTTDLDRAVNLAGALSGLGIGMKIGKEFFTSHGPAGIQAIREAAPSAPIFLDLKFHDIPNTVAGAVRAACGLGVDIVNIHASGGEAMMRAALQAAAETAETMGRDRPEVLAVTILTSLDDNDLAAIGYQDGASARAVKLAQLAESCGLDGVVCAATEITAMRDACGADFKLLTPGIRPAGAALSDQKRVMTPAEAAAAGSNYLVIGRPITGADNPRQAAEAILAELA